MIMINMKNKSWFHILYQLVHRRAKVDTNDITSVPYLFKASRTKMRMSLVSNIEAKFSTHLST